METGALPLSSLHGNSLSKTPRQAADAPRDIGKKEHQKKKRHEDENRFLVRMYKTAEAHPVRNVPILDCIVSNIRICVNENNISIIEYKFLTGLIT